MITPELLKLESSILRAVSEVIAASLEEKPAHVHLWTASCEQADKASKRVLSLLEGLEVGVTKHGETQLVNSPNQCWQYLFELSAGSTITVYAPNANKTPGSI